MRADIKAPGLSWRHRATGDQVPYWIASKEAVRAGFQPSTVNLSSLTDDSIAAKCARLQNEMLRWLTDQGKCLAFDGRLGSLLELYQKHPESPFHGLKPSTRVPYVVYLARIDRDHGAEPLAGISGLDVKAWFKEWRGLADGQDKLGAATVALSVFKAALAFGLVTGIPGCAEECRRLREVCSALRFQAPRPRQFAPTAADVEKLRAEAHRLGHPRAALAYALQFETVQRQWDIVGQWVPLADPRPSAIIHSGQKWLGPTWGAIDADLVLTIKPTKTERSTGALVHVRLSACPMVMAELARIDPRDRSGPIIQHNGKPYHDGLFQQVWSAARDAAGLPSGMWNRDLRAGGNTEAEAAGASADDRAKLAGHSKKMNLKVYSRDRLAASDRVVELRAKLRERS
jgi:hypothetical protein